MMQSKSKGWVERLAPLVLFLIVCLFYWRLTLTVQYTWMDNPDISYQVYPWFQLQAREWHSSHLPMWDPTGWGGQPLFGQAQPGAAYPPNWLLFWLPLKDGFISQVAMNWYYVFIRYFGVLSCYWFCRSLNRSVAASLVGGSIYGLGGYLAATSWPQMTNGAVWTPLAFMYLFRAVRKGTRWPLTDAALSGLCLGVGWLAGHHQMNTLASVAAASTWLFLTLRRRRFNWKIAQMALISLSTAVMATAFQTVPMLEYGLRALRWVSSPEGALTYDQTIPYAVHQMFALNPQDILGVFLPGVESSAVLFLGSVGAMLGFAGICLGWRHRHVRWLSAIGASGLLFTFGANSLFHGIVYSLVPLVEKARVPAAGSLLFALGFAPLASFGVDLLCLRRNDVSTGRVAKVALTLGVLMFLVPGVSAMLHLANSADPRVGVTAICSCVVALTLWGWSSGRISRSAVTTLLLMLVLFELAPSANYTFPNKVIKADNKFLPKLSEHADLAKFLSEQPDYARIEYNTDDVPYNFGTWYGFNSRNAYAASVLTSTMAMNLYSEQAQNFWGVKYYLGKQPNHPGLRQVFEGASGVKIFINERAMDRSWLVHQVLPASDEAEISAKLADGTLMRSTAFVSAGAAPELETCDTNGEASHISYMSPNAVRIVAQANCRSLVMLSDAWYPGWGATVDGLKSEILKVDGGFRGVAVGQGSHTIEMHYRPRSVFAGLAITLFSIVGTLAISALERHRRRGRGSR